MSAVLISAENRFAPRVAPGWEARLELGFRSGANRTELHHRKRFGPLTVQRPFYPERDVCHIYVLHPPAGVVGGDSLEIDVSLDDAAQALITAPGAGKFYRSAGDIATLAQRFRCRGASSLEWLPQENIFFQGAQVQMRTQIELDQDSKLAFREINCLGRPVVKEGFEYGHVDTELDLSIDGSIHLKDRLQLDAQSLAGAAVLRGYSVSAMALFYPADESLREQARSVKSSHDHESINGITLLDNVLVVRVLCHSAGVARERLDGLWRAIRPLVAGHRAITPRIWST